MRTKTLLTGTAIGTLVMFFWGATEWFNPILKLPYKTAENTAELHQTLLEHMPENGMYIWPNGTETKTGDGKAKDIVYFMAKKDASFYNPGKFMWVELLTKVLTWFLLTYTMLWSKLGEHGQRVKLVLIVAILVGLAFYMPMWNWWGFSTAYVLVRWLNMLVGWGLAGAAVSYMLRKQIQR